MGAPPRYGIEVTRRLPAGSHVRVAGRVVRCDAGAVVMADDGGLLEVVPTGPEADGDRAPEGAWVTVDGVWDGTRVRGRVRVASIPDGAFPAPGGDWLWLQEGGARRIGWLRARAAVLRALRGFFDGRGFLEVDTPAMVPSPGLDVHLDAFEVAGAPDGPRWLSTSPEYQMKRLLAGGLSRIYQLCKCFRRGERGGRHEPEFTMLEWYRTFAEAEAVMADTEEAVAAVAEQVRGGSRRVRVGDGTVDLTPPWERLTVEQAFARHAGADLWAVLPDEDRFYRILVEAVEPRLGRGRPTFLVDWPASMASLARLKPDDPRVAERFEAYAGGLELCNGFGELIDPREQRARLERDQRVRRELGKPVHPIDEAFLAALSEGLPPCAGNALGVDRLVMLLLEVDHIADVQAVPSRRL